MKTSLNIFYKWSQGNIVTEDPTTKFKKTTIVNNYKSQNVKTHRKMLRDVAEQETGCVCVVLLPSSFKIAGGHLAPVTT